MATKKTKEEVVEEVIAKEEVPQAKPAAPDPNERVDVFIPRGERGGDPNYYISVNNYRAILPKGQTSSVPRYIAEEIERCRKAEAEFFNYAEEKIIK